MDRRKFLTLGVGATAASVVGLSGLVPLTQELISHRLYVSFTNPRPKVSIIIPVPFSGQYKGVQNVEPNGTVLIVSQKGTELEVGDYINTENDLSVSVKQCQEGTALITGYVEI